MFVFSTSYVSAYDQLCIGFQSIMCKLDVYLGLQLVMVWLMIHFEPILKYLSVVLLLLVKHVFSVYASVSVYN